MSGKPKAWEGFETWWHELQMKMKMIVYLSVVIFLLWLLGAVVVFKFLHSPEYINLLKLWIRAEVEKYVFPFREFAVEIGKHTYHMTAREVATLFQKKFAGDLFTYFTKASGVFVVTYAVIMALACKYFKKRSRKEIHEPRKERGVQPVEPKELNRLLKKSCKSKRRLKITKHIELPFELENRHIAVLGASGTGKSVFIKNVLYQLKKYGEVKCIVFDLKGEYLSIFYDSERDMIFNPIDARCVPWDIYADIHDVTTEVYDVARSFVPPLKGEGGVEKYFSDAARDVFAAILEVTYRLGGWEYDKLADLVLSGPFRIYEFLKEHESLGGKKGLIHIAKPDSNQALGVCSTMSQYMRVLDVFRGLPRRLSLRKWLQSGSGWLFLPVPPAFTELLSPAITALINLLMKEALSLPDDLNRRIFFVMDELGNLLYMNRLIDVATLGRSKGACLIVGTQDFGRIDARYSKPNRQTLFSNCKTWAVFRVADPGTLKELEDKFGEAEVEEKKKSYSLGVEDVRDGISFTRDVRIKKAFLASEIQQLPDLHCIVHVGEFPPARDLVKFIKYETIAKDFEPRQIPESGSVFREEEETTKSEKSIKIRGRKEPEENREEKEKEELKKNEIGMDPEKTETETEEEVSPDKDGKDEGYGY